MNPGSRVVAAALSFGVLAAACGPSDSSSTGASAAEQTRGASGGSAGPSETGDPFACSPDPIEPSPVEDVPSALPYVRGDAIDPSLGLPTIDQNDVVAVLRPDGIPAIDAPKCHRASEVGFLEDPEAVVSVEVNGEARAYPLQILTWHELVNDTIGGVPLTVSYCPLCNSALVYERRVGDRVLSFGTSGSLHQSSLVMYDRQTQSVWTHFDGVAFAGAMVGTELEFVPAAVVSWEEWRNAYPDGLVLSRDTGERRDYGVNPYVGYETGEPFGRFITNDVDPRLPAKDRVIGLWDDTEAVAVTQELLNPAGVIDVDLSGQRITVWSLPGAASALDTMSVAAGRDVGSKGAFVPVVDGQELTFARTDAGFVDAETGSTWTIFGEAVAGELAGAQLEAVRLLDTFWFAWATFHEGTALIDGR